MPAPTTGEQFLELVRKSGVVDQERLDAHVQKLRDESALPDDPKKLAGLLVRDGLLTYFQSGQFLQGKWRGFTLGQYKVLEKIGSGGMGQVYLCEHLVMRRRVAIKVLPTNRADDPSSLGRFQREAQAAAALDHPNIVRAHDFSQEGNLYFLVMEYINGINLQESVQKGGPMDPTRAAHYVRQAALGLQHAHETAGLVHRDIKPGNILVDRSGTVKILDMGLARFAHERGDALTSKYDEKSVLGTADYLSPEQAMNSHDVDIRADIYSLGATFYFLLTGRPPFGEGTVAQKIIWHQMRPARPVRDIRPEVPEGLAAIVDKMLAKDPADRYQTPAELALALEPWTETPIPPPAEMEFRRLSPAAMAGSLLAGSASSYVTAPALLAPMLKDGQAGPPSRARPRSGQRNPRPHRRRHPGTRAGRIAQRQGQETALAPDAANAGRRTRRYDGP
jgi:eukaryotic-like serine/threonine-protein kinase